MDERDRELVSRYFRDKLSGTERVGCPERAVLEQIAAGKLPPASPWYNHLTACGGCFREAEQIRVDLQVAARARRTRLLVGLGLAASLMVAAFLLLRPTTPPHTQAGPARPTNVSPVQQPPTPGSEVLPDVQSPPLQARNPPSQQRLPGEVATVDLTAFSIARGTAVEPSVPAPSVRTGQQTVHIILPVASEPGTYNVKMLNKDLKTVRETTGVAAIRGGRSILRVVLDAAVTPGIYQLALQHDGEEWRLYPLEVKPN